MLQTLLLPGGILCTLYLTYLALRTCKQCAISLKPWEKILAGSVIAVFVTLCCIFRGVGTILILHIVGIDLVLTPLGLLFLKKGRNLWGRLRGALALLLALGIVLWGYVNMYNIQKTEYTLYTSKNIRQSGYKVALIADVHYGVSLHDSQLQALCQRISQDKVDLVILCGDIVDENTGFAQMQSVFRIFGTIDSTYGVYYIYGNHDRALPGGTHRFTSQELETAIVSSGITIVRDEALSITEDLVLIGREDPGYDSYPYDRLPAETLISGTSQEDFLLFAEHKPASYEENANAGADLIVSGHTHGGQIWPINLLIAHSGANDNMQGLMQYSETTAGIVTTGLACWGFDVKNAAPAEYVVITILPE